MSVTVGPPILTLKPMQFPHRIRADWERECRQGQSSLLGALKPSFLTRIIEQKSGVRPRRFFGEAFFAAEWGYEEAWYSSYKWLTSPIWSDSRRLTEPFHREFKAALHKHFPNGRLAELQAKALALTARVQLRPMPPDLWLIREGVHWFVEVKIPPDDVSDSQLAGLAVIATCLPSDQPIRVACAYVSEEGSPLQARRQDLERQFASFCRLLQGKGTLP